MLHTWQSTVKQCIQCNDAFGVLVGKFNKHVDTWDSNEKNSFFSFEGFMFVQKQIWNFSKPGNLATPEFCILKKYKKYEIRR